MHLQNRTIMEMDGSGSSSSESKLVKVKLKFGQKIYFEDVGVGGVQKKGVCKCSHQGVRWRGVLWILSEAKTYYSRHKVCGIHSKTAAKVVDGLKQRFWQQCSRFHLLPEFDQGKRSCCRRLTGTMSGEGSQHPELEYVPTMDV